MRKRVRAGFLAGVVVLVVSACQDMPPPKTEFPTSPPGSTVLARTPVPAGLTEPAPPFSPPTPATPQPGVAPTEIIVTDIANQVQVNLAAASLRLTKPPGWVILDSQQQPPPWPARLGPDSVLLVDSKETGSRLFDQEVIGSGAFLLALPAKLPVDFEKGTTNPIDALSQLLRLLSLRSEIVLTIHSMSIGGVLAAYADLPRDPLALFVRKELNAHLRFILVYPPDAAHGAPLLLLLGAERDNWPTFEPIFNQMLNTTVWQAGVVADRSRRVSQGRVNPDESVTGLLNNDQTDIWVFEGESGTYATLTVNPHSLDTDLTLLLIGPSGETLEQADFGLPGEAEVMFDVPLPATGEYQVEVAEFFGEAGNYTLSLALSETPQFEDGGEINLSQVITGELEPSARPVWTFQGNAGQLVTIVVTPLNEQLDLIFELSGPDGQLLAVKDETFVGDPEVLVGFELPLTGTYKVQIRSFSDRGGGYTLALNGGGESTANFYDAGDLVYGNVKRDMLQENEVHAWFFEGYMGDEITVLVTPLGDNLDMDIWLLDPLVHRLAQKDENLSGEAEMIEMTLPVDGLYAVMVREFFGEPGEYEISITAKGYDNLEDAGEIAYGQTVIGMLMPGKGAVWHFAGTANTKIELTLTPGDNRGDLVLILRNPNGEEVARVDLNLAGEREQLRAFNITSDGDWTIVIEEFFDEGVPYELTLTRLE